MGFLSSSRLVSIIIPSKDEGGNLLKTIAAIKSTTAHRPYELIVVDDGSGADGAAVVKTHPDVRVVRGDGLGVAKARNAGAARARGEILVFCDAHVFPVQTEWLGALVQALRDPSVGLCAPCVVVHGNPDHKGYGLSLAEDLSCSWNGRHAENVFEVQVIPGGATCVRTEVFRRLGGWCGLMNGWGSDDQELSLRAWMQGYRQVVVPHVEIEHIFRSRFPYTVTYEQPALNSLVMGALHFSEKRFIDLLQRHRTALGDERMNELLKSVAPEVMAERKRLATTRKYSDDWFFEKFKRSSLPP